MKNLDKSKVIRNRLNYRHMSTNYRANREQSFNTGDPITIQDRTDSNLLKTQYKKILEHTFEVNKPQTTVKDNIDWYCSLRQSEHDHAFDGIRPLKRHDFSKYSSMVSLGTIKEGESMDK
jgi:hypothetical protein